MGYTKWDPLMEQRVRVWYGVKPTRELAAELGVTVRSLMAKANRMGVVAKKGYSGKWFPDEIETLQNTYPLLGEHCAPLCHHTERQTASRAQYEGLHKLGKSHKPSRNSERRRVVLMMARWCQGHGRTAQKTLEACAEAAGCTSQMLRLALPEMVAQERARSLKEKKARARRNK